MHKTEKQILNVLQGQIPDHTPIWLMRQAGRYLPEYRELRSKAKNFLNLCLTPDWATEITLQPIKRFNLDAAILFADILLVPMALGAGLEFREGEGPHLEPTQSEKSIQNLNYNNTKLLNVFEAVARVKAQLPKHVALIGFCGSPWTVACYMIDGHSKGGFATSNAWVSEKPALLSLLIQKLLDASEIYLSHQIDAGAEILQLFDSWAGLLKGQDFHQWIIEPTRELVLRMKRKYPHIPIIGFPREAAPQDYAAYLQKTGVDAMSIDFNLPLSFAKENLKTGKPLQGNLDPALLVEDGEKMKRAAAAILEALGPTHIFNLGHGVVPQTPPEHVEELVHFVHAFKR